MPFQLVSVSFTVSRSARWDLAMKMTILPYGSSPFPHLNSKPPLSLPGDGRPPLFRVGRSRPPLFRARRSCLHQTVAAATRPPPCCNPLARLRAAASARVAACTLRVVPCCSRLRPPAAAATRSLHVPASAPQSLRAGPHSDIHGGPALVARARCDGGGGASSRCSRRRCCGWCPRHPS